MKILLVSNMYPSKEYPAYGIFVKNQVELLKEAGVEVDLLVIKKSTSKLKKILSYIKHYIKIINRMIKRDYNFIYVHYASHNALPIIIGKKLNTQNRIIVNVHGSDVIPETKIQEKLSGLVTELLGISEIIIVPSPYFKKVVNDKYSIKDKIFFISPSGGIDLGIFNKKFLNEVPASLSFDTKFRYVGYVGRIDIDKGWDDLLIAFHKLSSLQSYTNIKLIMVGSGKEALRRNILIEQLGLDNKVIIIETVPQNLLMHIYNALDVFVFPTKRKGESLGLVGIEAMACGVPVIGSNIGGLKSYIIDGENGLFFNTGDTEDLTNKLIEFFELKSTKVDKMKKSSINTAKKYDQELVKEELINFLLNI